MFELIALITIFVGSLFLWWKNELLALSVLLVTSLFLHKQLFSFVHWNLLPVRFVMVALTLVLLAKLSLRLVKRQRPLVVLSPLGKVLTGLLGALWLVRLVSLFWSLNLLASFTLFAFFTSVVALALFIFTRFRDCPACVLRYIDAYIWLAGLLGLFAIYQAYIYLTTGVIVGALWNVPDKLPRLGSLFWDVNHFGGFLSAVLPVLFARILTSEKWYLGVARGGMFLLLLGLLFLTNSRTAWLSFAVGSLVFSLLFLYRRFGSRGLLVLSSLVLVVLISFGVEFSDRSSPFRYRIKEYFHYRLDSFAAHFMLLEGSLEIFNSHFILGGGYGSFFEHFAQTEVATEYFGRDPVAFTTRVPAHTIWGEVLAETGLIGFGVFILFWGVSLLILLKVALTSYSGKARILAMAMTSSLVGWLFAGIFYSYNSEFFYIIVFLYLAYALGNLDPHFDLSALLKYVRDSLDVGAVSILSLAGALIFLGLGHTHLIPWDEAIYAGIAKHMLQTHNYAVPVWRVGQPWFEKPPLMLWLMSFSMRFLGVNSWGARLPSALLGFGTVLIVYIWAKRLFGKGSAFISVLALVTSVHFLYYARASMMDVAVTFFITLSLYAYYRAIEPDISPDDSRFRYSSIWWVLFGSSVGLAVMVKNVVGLLPFLIVGLHELYLVVSSNRKPLPFIKSRIRYYLLALLYSLGVILPWHVYMHLSFGTQFWDSYIGYHVLSRALSSIEDKGEPFLWYLIVLKVSMRLWFLALIPAYPFALFKRDRRLVLPLIWSLAVFLFFSVSKSKLVWYITPLYPALSLLIGWFISWVISWVSPKLATLKGLRMHPVLISASAYFGLAFIALAYFYFVRGMVYTSDFTGAQAELLRFKDSRFGIQSIVYVDQMELPLIIFYTDGPYAQTSLSLLKKRLQQASNSESVIFITKESRFRALSGDFPERLELVAQIGDWALGWFKPAEQLLPYDR